MTLPRPLGAQISFPRRGTEWRLQRGGVGGVRGVSDVKPVTKDGVSMKGNRSGAATPPRPVLRKSAAELTENIIEERAR